MNSKNTKRALLGSVVAMLVCFTMLLSTTFAWFTDTAVSGSNVITSGTLTIALTDANGASLEGEMIEWATADDRAQDEILWEPGCTYNTEEFYIENTGNLNLKFKFAVTGIDGDAKLLEVIDFEVLADATQLNLTSTEPVDLITDNGEYVLAPGGKVGPLVLTGKMDTTAGNEYQGLTIVGIAVSVVATQATVEEDSFDDQYDAAAEYDEDAPLANVTVLDKTSVIKNSEGKTVLGEDLTVSTEGSLNWGVNLGSNLSMDTAYQFEPSLPVEEAEVSDYADWHADFVVYANKDVPAYALALTGYYDAWCQFNDDAWVALASADPIPANQEIRLVEFLGATVSYTELSEYGNDGIGFLCGAIALDNDMLSSLGVTTEGLEDGTVLTVELRLYEATGSSLDTETGEYILVDRYNYKF